MVIEFELVDREINKTQRSKMASKRSITKRDSQIKTLNDLIGRAKGHIEGEDSEDLGTKDEVGVLLRNIKGKKESHLLD